MRNLVLAGIGAALLLAVSFWLNHVARRRSIERDRSTLHVALVLGRHDDGLRLLDASSGRPGEWWTVTPEDDLREIDRALSGWDVVARHVADHQVDRDVILDVYGWQVVELWEQAYTYVEAVHPDLWSSLLDLYVDAWAAVHPGGPVAEDDAEDESTAVTPDEVPEPPDLPAALVAPLLPTPPVTAVAAPEPSVVPEPAAPVRHDRLADIRLALRPVTPPTPGGPLRRGAVSAETDTPPDLVIDLVGPGTDATGPLPRAVHR